MKLYYSKGACSLAVRIVINEMGLASDYESVNLKTKKTETGKDFLAINSKGAVPTLELNNGEVLTENAVIQQYLADTNHHFGLLPRVGEQKRYRVLEWLNYVATEIHKGVGALYNPNLSEEMRNSIVLPNINSKLTYLNNHLKNHHYLVGDEFSLPDAYLFTVLSWTFLLNISLIDYPSIERYYNEVKARPAVQKSLQEEGLQ